MNKLRDDNALVRPYGTFQKNRPQVHANANQLSDLIKEHRSPAQASKLKMVQPNRDWRNALKVEGKTALNEHSLKESHMDEKVDELERFKNSMENHTQI